MKHGTGTKAVLRGVERYLKDHGVNRFSLMYQGWRPHQKRFSSGVKVPNLNWMKATLAQNGALWLNVGWYTYNASRGEYRRIGGHWVEAIGYGLRRDGTRDATYMTIHDPAPRAGQSKREHYTQIKSLSAGTFVGPKRGLPQPASGYYQLGGEFRVKKKAGFGIIDAAIALRLK